MKAFALTIAALAGALALGAAYADEEAQASRAHPSLNAQEIIAMAQESAGGETWRRPGSLRLVGYNIIYGDNPAVWDQYAMWRVFANDKTDAHAVSGKVRIEAWRDGALAMLVAFDGAQTSNQFGIIADQSANQMWSNNFGYGAIRNALDEGWTQERVQDRLIDGAPSFMVRLTDPSGGATLFGIRQSDSAIVYVGFQTPRGWHERRYSEFFEKPGIDWVQPGRVRLFYDGVKSNEAVWTDFEIGAEYPDAQFLIEAAPDAPSF